MDDNKKKLQHDWDIDNPISQCIQTPEDTNVYLDFPVGSTSPIDGPAIDFNPLLDTLHTSEPKPMLKNFKIHSGLDQKAEYIATKAALSRIPSDAKTKPADRLENCSTSAWFFRHMDTGEVRVAANRCNYRWCPSCANTRRRVIAESIGQWLLKRRGKRFITLTLKNSAAPLAGQVDLLYTYFKYLRKKALWKDNVKGGIWFFQITQNKSTGEWHPHIHVLVDSKWIEKYELSEAWLSITKNSFITDIRRVDSDMKASEYVARYGSKPGTLADKSLTDGMEMIQALHDRRLIGAFGSARGLQFRPKPPEDAGDWENVGSWFEVRNLYEVDERARLIFRAWHYKCALQAGIGYVMPPPPDPPPKIVKVLSTFKQHQFDFMIDPNTVGK